ncbi:MAG TPA: hypothetical protein VKA87_05825 [Nitrososphaeraceae archaeon]|nr:hypothetical protein [Nitrososphaeraceae archaeon]
MTRGCKLIAILKRLSHWQTQNHIRRFDAISVAADLAVSIVKIQQEAPTAK